MAMDHALAQNYSEHPDAAAFVERMVREHNFDKPAVQQLMANAERKQSIIDAISRPAELTLTWAEYRKIFIQDSRVEKGVVFWQDNQGTLVRATEQYGVPEEIIVAIIGVETRYGENKGSYRVLDALSTLGFDYPPRATFFRKELEHFLLLSREQKQDPTLLQGSYAGAMGYGQFMPSSFRSYAVDFDGDEIADIWENPVDAIGSVANYLGRHGWQKNQTIAVRARVSGAYNSALVNRSLNADVSIAELMAGGIEPVRSLQGEGAAMAMKLDGDNGAEFWVGLKNFSVITRYNRSQLYAMAVYQLADTIKQHYQLKAE
jgi:membrane-bound lytic murein transglycosylase B